MTDDTGGDTAGGPRYCRAAYCTARPGHPGPHTPLHHKILGAGQPYPAHADPCECHPAAASLR